MSSTLVAVTLEVISVSSYRLKGIKVSNPCRVTSEKIQVRYKGRYSGTVVSTEASQQEGPWFEPAGLCGVYMFPRCLCGFSLGRAAVLPQSKDKSKTYECEQTGGLSNVDPASCSVSAVIGSSSPRPSAVNRYIDNGQLR